jgi:hypothetical protein
VHEFVRAVNNEFRHELSFPRGHKMLRYMNDFKHLYGLSTMVGAIDGTHFHIRKPAVSPKDYFYFKTNGYTIACQAVVDSERKILDIFVGMHGSTNDAHMLRRSSLCREVRQGNLFDAQFGQDNFGPYLIGDKGYPLLPWLQTVNCRATLQSEIESGPSGCRKCFWDTEASVPGTETLHWPSCDFGSGCCALLHTTPQHPPQSISSRSG